MSNKRKNSHHPVVGPKAGRVRRLTARLGKLVLKRAVSKAVHSIERNPPSDVHLLRAIGLEPSDAERLASELHILAADPYRITLNPSASATKSKPRCR